MNELQTLVAAILSIPWTIIGVRLHGWPTQTGTDPNLRKAIMVISIALQAIAIYGALTI